MGPSQIIALASTALSLLEQLSSQLEAFDDNEIDQQEMKEIRDRARNADQRIDQKAKRLGIMD